MFADPVVRNLTYLVLALVIGALVMVMGVVISGITAPTGPRTLTENELAVSGAAVRSGKADAATWGSYIAALIANGRYSQAQNVIAEAKASVSDTGTAEFAVAEVRLSNARKDYAHSIAVANKGQKDIEAAHKIALAGGGLVALRAKMDGLHDNWYNLALLKSDAYKAMGQWDNVIKELSAYIDGNPGSSDILIDRGNARIQVKDTAGAEADFREALKFVPDDKEALAGLKKIGAATK